MATVTGSYNPDNDHLSLAGDGYSMDEATHVIYTHPDGSTESWYIGVITPGVLDDNYILANHLLGDWKVDVYQGTAGHGKHSQAVLVASTTVSVFAS